MDEFVSLPLKMDKCNLVFKPNRLLHKKEELENFLSDENGMDKLTFARNALIAKEVQSNNGVEGYYDGIDTINKVVKKKENPNDVKKTSRILNLHDGYDFILNHKNISEQSLKELYAILSKNLLIPYDVKEMGEFYRTKPVYIYYSSDVTKPPDLGVDPEMLKSKMDALLEFINNYSLGNDAIDEYIKSQIMHFYFVYVHPYFDINGRCSRTLSIWYLLNKKAYPYVIFNRGINMNKSEYYKVIKDAKTYSNVTFFINYMMQTLLVELQKEHVISNIKESTPGRLRSVDVQTINYLLSMSNEWNVKTFLSMYNRFNDKKSCKEIEEAMIIPLIDKGILIPKADTQTYLYKNHQNYSFGLNPVFFDDDAKKTCYLKIKK